MTKFASSGCKGSVDCSRTTWKQEPSQCSRQQMMVGAVCLESDVQTFKLEVKINKADGGWLDWTWEARKKKGDIVWSKLGDGW